MNCHPLYSLTEFMVGGVELQASATVSPWLARTADPFTPPADEDKGTGAHTSILCDVKLLFTCTSRSQAIKRCYTAQQLKFASVPGRVWFCLCPTRRVAAGKRGGASTDPSTSRIARLDARLRAGMVAAVQIQARIPSCHRSCSGVAQLLPQIHLYSRQREATL